MYSLNVVLLERANCIFLIVNLRLGDRVCWQKSLMLRCAHSLFVKAIENELLNKAFAVKTDKPTRKLTVKRKVPIFYEPILAVPTTTLLTCRVETVQR